MSDKENPPPLCCQLNNILLEVGNARVLEIVRALADSGMARDEINKLLQTEIVPQYKAWRATKLDHLMRILSDASATIN